MVWHAVILAILFFLVVGLPSPSSALSVAVSVGGVTCSPAPTVASVTLTTTAPRTTTLLLAAPFDCFQGGVSQGIRVTCSNCTLDGGNKWKALARTSGGIMKVSLNNTRIINTTSPAANRSLRITAVSGNNPTATPAAGPDFLAVASGGRSAGVVLNAGVTGTNPTGDTIAVTGRLTTNTTRIVNQMPAGSTDLARSLPSVCTGNLSCVFTATTGTTNISDQITETIQVTCPTGSTTCTPQMTVEVDVTLKAGDRWDLPNSAGFSVPVTPEDSPNLIQDSPVFDAFKATLQILGGSKFAFESVVTLGAGTEGIDPVVQAVQLALEPTSLTGSSFSTTMLSFKKISSGSWTFKGVVAGVQLAAVIKQLNLAGTKFGVAIGGSGANLTGIDDQVRARLTIGEQTGQALIKPRFF